MEQRIKETQDAFEPAGDSNLFLIEEPHRSPAFAKSGRIIHSKSDWVTVAVMDYPIAS